MPVPSATRAFHLHAVAAAAGLDPIAPGGMVPALAAHYRDLTALRYDYPAVLLDDAADGDLVKPLSTIVDDLLREIADGDDHTRIAAHVLDIERHLRIAASRGERGALRALWDRTVATLGPRDDAWQDSVRRARAALMVDGELVDCDATASRRIVRHLWQARQRDKSARFRAHADRLVRRLSEILRGDRAHSCAGRNDAALRSSFGGSHRELFDFQALATAIASRTPATIMPAARRDRLLRLIAALEEQPFYPGSADHALPFAFDSCAAAAQAYRERLPALRHLVSTLGAAELEGAGQYHAARHDEFFAQLDRGQIALDARDLALFPDYLVQLPASALSPIEYTAFLDILDARLPIKVLVDIDDVLPAALGSDQGRGRARQLARIAAGLGRTFVLQAPSSHLVQMHAQIARGLGEAGPALLSVFTGTAPTLAGLTPYLAGALALETRVFPALIVHPTGSGADLSFNPQPNADWPVYPLDYETGAHARASDDIALTAADLLACDRRQAGHFAVAPESLAGDCLVPLHRWLSLPEPERRASAPFIWLTGETHRLRRVIVDAAVARETEECLEHWRGMRQLAPSPDQTSPVADTAAVAAPTAPVDTLPTAPTVVPVPGESADRPAGVPYIETPRCSSCNECIQLNGRMFKYDANNQAYIADADAGTYRELVEAAESCQVSIIHPGVPRRPDEPGLDELLQRAAAFP